MPTTTNPLTINSCQKGEPFMKLGNGPAPVLNYQLPVTSTFDTRGIISIPLPKEQLRPELFRVPTETIWTFIQSLSIEEILAEVFAVLRGQKGKYCIFQNEYLLKGMAILHPFEPEEFKAEKYSGKVPPRFANKEAQDKWFQQQQMQSPRPRPYYSNIQGLPVSDALFDPYTIANTIKEGGLPVIIRNIAGLLDIQYVYQPRTIIPQLFMVEHYKVATYARDYGAAKTVATFSLLPGEKTTISMRSYTKKETTKARSENVLDSFSQNSSHSFENILQVENQLGVNSQNSDNWNNVNAYSNSANNTITQNSSLTGTTSSSTSFELGGTLAGGIFYPPVVFGGAIQMGGGFNSNSATNYSNGGGSSSSVITGLSSQNEHQVSSSTIRDEINNVLQSAIDKSVVESSSHRQIDINTTTTESYTQETEYSTVRELVNINYSRVLNFVFRQLCQQYLSITSLDDVSFVYTNGLPESNVVVKLSGLEQLLKGLFVNEADAMVVMNNILAELCSVKDYQGNPQQFIKCSDWELSLCCGDNLTATQHILQKNPTLVQEVEGIRIKGVVLDVRERILPVEHVVVDALLGQGEALDCYNSRLQESGAVKAEQENIDRQISLDMRQIELQNRAAEIQLQLQERQMDLDERQTEIAVKNQAMAIIDLITDPVQKAELYKKVFGNCCENAQTQIIP